MRCSINTGTIIELDLDARVLAFRFLGEAIGLTAIAPDVAEAHRIAQAKPIRGDRDG